jgi:hypothetical protein
LRLASGFAAVLVQANAGLLFAGTEVAHESPTADCSIQVDEKKTREVSQLPQRVMGSVKLGCNQPKRDAIDRLNGLHNWKR